jgi:hypothetical protein
MPELLVSTAGKIRTSIVAVAKRIHKKVVCLVGAVKDRAYIPA